MKLETLKEVAVELGFSGCKLMDTKEIPLNEAFRSHCEENICGMYGASYACPPACGTPEEMAAKIHAFRQALVLESAWKVKNVFDSSETMPPRKEHNVWMLQLKDLLQRHGIPSLMIGASHCTLCDRCKILDGQPCVNPDLKFSCVSAYCVDMMSLTQKLGWDMLYRGEELKFYGILLF